MSRGRRPVIVAALGLVGLGLANPGLAQTLSPEARALKADQVAEDLMNLSGFDKVRTPDSPAAVLLGVSATEMQRPGTPTAVAASLSGFVSGADLMIPKNLGVEFSPYWLFPHRTLQADEYESGSWRNLYRTLTLSLVTKQTERTSVDATGATLTHSDSDLGVGLRLRLFGTYQQCKEEKKALETAAQDLAAMMILPADVIEKIRQAHPDPSSKEFADALADAQTRHLAEHKEEFDRAGNAIEQARAKLVSACKLVAGASQGWSGALAGASDFYFADSKATRDAAEFLSGAGWLTIAWANDWFSGIALARYVSRKIEDERQSLADGGLRLVLKQPQFAVSAEGILRWRASGPGKELTYKLDMAAEYEIRDQVWVSVAFGKNYDSGQAGSLFSLANFSWGFGKPSLR